MYMYTLKENFTYISMKKHATDQRCTNPGHQVAVVPKFGTVASNIYGRSVWNFLHGTHLAPRILGWLLYCWKICAQLL